MPSVLVVGAGPAGLAAAMALREAGLTVTVYDEAARYGGKLGADPDSGGTRRDHGLHIFPAWYLNLREIMATLGVSGGLRDHEQVAYVGRGKFPGGVRTMRSPTSVAAALHNTLRGPLPWYQAAIYQYFMLDLAGQPLRRRSFLDRISETGLMYGRWYRDDGVAGFIEANVLHAASVNASEISAMSWQRVLRYWLRMPSPFFSVMTGDLQTALIDPWVAHVAGQGVTLERQRRVTRLRMSGGRVVGVDWRDTGGATGTVTPDVVVLAVPLEAALTLCASDDAVLAAAPGLGKMNALDSEPMSGFHVELSQKVAGLGRDFLFLMGSEYGISLIDVTPDAEATTLSCVVGDFGPLRTLSDGLITRLLLDELHAYLPFPAAAIVRTFLHNNVSAPLFVNSVGSWQNRPKAKTKIDNLFMAGDWVRNAIDLATTEGAISSGLHTANQVGRELGIAVRRPKQPPEHPRLLYRLAAAASAPAMILPVAVSRLRGDA